MTAGTSVARIAANQQTTWVVVVRKAKKGLPFLVLMLAVLLPACGDQFFDKEKVYSIDERISDVGKGADLLNAMDKAHIDKTVLIGAYDAAFDPNEKPKWSSSEASNLILLEAKKKAPNRIEIFPLIRGDEPKMLDYVKELVTDGARGFHLSNGVARLRRMPLTDERLRPLYQWCELNRLSIHLDLDWDQYHAEFEQLLRDYPNLFFVVSGMLGLADNLDKLEMMFERYPNLFVDLSFGFEPDKLRGLQALSRQRDKARELIINEKERFLFATDVRIANAPGRNLDWLNEYFFDSRSFLERGALRLKLLLNGQPTIQKIDGLKLPTDVLEFVYHHNFNNIITEHPSEYEKYNLDHLLRVIPPRAQYDEEASYRLVTALVTGFTNPAEGVFSTFLHNVLSGAVTSWKEITGADTPLHLAALAPLDQWIPRRMKVDRPVKIEVAPNAEALLALLARDPGTLAMVPFDQLTPAMKVLLVDGEAPTGRYVRDCAKRGGATIGTYFHSYPVLIPLAVPDAIPAEMIYDPYQIRTVMIGDDILPAELPGGEAGDVQPADDAIFPLGAMLRESDVAMTVVESPLVDNCASAPGDNRLCTDRRWLAALDFTGVDVVAALGRHLLDYGQLALTETLALFRRHSIAPFQSGITNAVTIHVRGQSFVFLGYDSGYLSSWSADTLRQEVKQAMAGGGRVFVFLYQDQTADEQSMQGAARAAIEAGAETALIVGRFPPRPMALYQQHVLVRGLGNLADTDETQSGSDLAFLARYVFYQTQLVSVDLIPLQLKNKTVQVAAGAVAHRAFSLLFPN